MPSNHLILCHPLLLLPSIFPNIRVFYNEAVLRIGWPKDWSFRVSPSNEYSELISFRIDWFDLLAVQETLKSLLQHHNWISSSALSLVCGPTLTFIHDCRKTIALTIRTFVHKMTSPLTLSRFVLAFLPRSKCLLISWLQSPPGVILEPKKMKSFTLSTFSPSICFEVMGPDAMMLVFWMLSFKSVFSHSSFTLIKRLFSSFLLSAITVVCIICISEIVEAILIPASDSFSLALEAWCYSVCKLHDV